MTEVSRRWMSVAAGIALGTATLAYFLAAPQPPSQVRTPVAHRIEIRALQFHPPQLTVRVGDTVKWVNHDIMPHTASAAKPDSSWDTGNIGPRETGMWVAAGAADYEYICKLHPIMSGRLNVER